MLNVTGGRPSYVDFLMRDNRWTELKPQLERSDNGNSHSRTLEVKLWMLSEYRRTMDSRERGHSRLDYFLSQDRLEQIVAAPVHPSNRRVD